MRYKVVTLLVLLLFLSGCVSSDKTIETLEKAGFTDIEVTDWEPFSCSDDDWYSTGFRAKNQKGDIVEGVVCCGLIFKSCTIRF